MGACANNEAMGGMGPMHMEMMPPPAMAGMDAPMMEAMPPAAMAGMTAHDGSDAPGSDGRYGTNAYGDDAAHQQWLVWMLQ